MPPRCFQWRRNHSFNHISGDEACHHLLAHEISERKAVLRPERAAMLPSPARLDAHGLELPRLDPGDVSDTQGVKRMRLLDTRAGAVPARSPSAPGTDGQTQCLQGLHHLVPGRVDRRGIPERALGHCFHLGVAKLGSGLVPFGLVTAATTERQVADAARAIPAARSQVIQLKWPVLLPTIDAAIFVLEEQVGPDFPSRKRSLLILLRLM